MHVELFMNQKTNGNSYVVDDGKDCYIVDPGGFDMSSLLNYIDEKKFNLSGVLLTHGHYDHIIGLPEIMAYKDVPVYISEKDYDFLYDTPILRSSLLTFSFVIFLSSLLVIIPFGIITSSF